MKRLLFFADRNDLTSVIKAVEASAQLKYARIDHYPSARADIFSSALDFDNLGRADFGSASGCTSFLVSDRTTQIRMEPIFLQDGAKRFNLDQLENSDTIVFTPAGILNDKIILHGRVATASDTVEAQRLMKLFAGVIRKKFTKVKAFYVGAGALAMLDAGVRLTISDQSPKDFDLAR